jgi:hypothetical protein
LAASSKQPSLAMAPQARAMSSGRIRYGGSISSIYDVEIDFSFMKDSRAVFNIIKRSNNNVKDEYMVGWGSISCGYRTKYTECISYIFFVDTHLL